MSCAALRQHHRMSWINEILGNPSEPPRALTWDPAWASLPSIFEAIVRYLYVLSPDCPLKFSEHIVPRTLLPRNLTTLSLSSCVAMTLTAGQIAPISWIGVAASGFDRSWSVLQLDLR